jgi:hypothetical protein
MDSKYPVYITLKCGKCGNSYLREFNSSKDADIWWETHKEDSKYFCCTVLMLKTTHLNLN